MTMFRRTTLGALSASLSVVILASCSSINSGAPAEGQTLPKKPVTDVTIGFAQRQVDAPYFAAMVQIAKDKAAQQGWTLKVQNADGDPITQIDQAQTLVSQGVDVLVVDAMSPASQKARFTDMEKQLPVVFVDTGIDGIGVTAVTSDNYTIGRLSGELAAKRFGAGQSITAAILNGGPDDEIVGPNRQKGFLDGLTAGGVEYTIVAEQPAVYSRDRAVPATESILAAHPDLDLILGLNDSMALGALTALQDMGNTTTVVAASADGQKDAIKLMVDQGCGGQYVSTGLNSPILAADRAFDVALEIGRGDTTPGSYDATEYTKSVGIDCSNAAEYYDPNSLF